MATVSIESENAALRQRIQELEAELAYVRSTPAAPHPHPVSGVTSELSISEQTSNNFEKEELPLSLDEYKRYGRQMIMPEIGLEGQLRLKRAKVLVVGAGGLGCPAAAYLAGAGVGTIGIIDHDSVEHSNLHRQILHASSKVGMSKVKSAITYLEDLNPHPTYIPHPYALSSTNALAIFQNYDLILDCTDHPSLRYLISDTAVILSKPVVSASALRKDGQLIILNDPPGIGPCYRCIWPRPPPAESVTSCGEGGVLGPVVGVMGVLQALQAIKVISRDPGVPAIGAEQKMTVFSAYPELAFRHFKMRGKRSKCVACGEPDAPEEKITRSAIEDGRMDYVAFCGTVSPVGLLKPDERVSATEYKKIRDSGHPHMLLDVRDKTQFGICRLGDSWNTPFSEFEAIFGSSSASSTASQAEASSKIPPSLKPKLEGNAAVYVLCRLGNDSQIVTRILKDAGVAEGRVWDVRGGIREWARSGARGEFPEY